MTFSKTDTKQYDRFYNYLDDLLQSYSRLSELLVKKLTAIAGFDIETLDAILKEEQVFVMLSKSFDSNIQSYREKLSLKGDSLSAVINEMPEEFRPRFQLVFTRLKAKLDEVKGLNGRCQSLIEERIYSLEKSIHQLDKSSTAAYGKPGAAKPAGPADPRMLHKSV